MRDTPRETPKRRVKFLAVYKQLTNARLVTSVEKLPALSGSVIEKIGLSISGLLQEVITKMSQASLYGFLNKDPRPIQLT
uniref:Uncharacterized protein n=1 Tax=Glossina palpalis gambiensis TaxID=67801 RepID=A0A1B0B5L8_9MUSC